jgi:pimeloyl-ACP methyl ester carboxylesterase
MGSWKSPIRREIEDPAEAAGLAGPPEWAALRSARRVADLRRRLAEARIPDFPFKDVWSFGMGKEIATELVRRWSNRIDRGALLDGLRDVPYARADFGGTWSDIVHFRAEIENALPIVLTHGWPSTVLELLPLARRLARPSAYGAEPADAFHVVIAALPGFPLGAMRDELEEYTAARIADRWVELMSNLGYARFAASGGDIGARVAAWLGARHPDRVIGIHVSSNALWPSIPETANLTSDEAAWVSKRADWTRVEGAYMHVQQTKPISLAYGLSASPLALAAWIGEKWHGWSGSDEVFERLSDVLLDTLSLYWLTNRIATSFLPYYVYDMPPGARPWGRDVNVPVSFYLCPNEIGGVPPRSFAERQYAIANWRVFDTGGHFLALESPDELAADIRAAFRATRSKAPPTVA